MNLHTPVLIGKILENLPNKSKLNIFDGTFGGGGYSREFLSGGHIVYACDWDGEAVKNEKLVENNNQQVEQNLHLSHSSFAENIQTFEEDFFDLIVLDLGYSSNQLEFSNRGFSYQKGEEVLDLRYDIAAGHACWDKIKNLKRPEEFFKTIYKYSGESFSPAIAKVLLSLVRSKTNTKPEIRVFEVVEEIKKVIPKKLTKKLNAILSRTWQALRIWTNDEFSQLEIFLPESVKKLKSKGLLMVVGFHSLEDKIVAGFMRDEARVVEISEFGDKAKYYNLLTPKAITPDEEEVTQNPRSRSGLLRILEKI